MHVVDEQREVADAQNTAIVIDQVFDDGQDGLNVIVHDGADGRFAEIEGNRDTNLHATDTDPA